MPDSYLEAWVVRYPSRGTVSDGIHRDPSPARKLPDMLADIIEAHLQ